METAPKRDDATARQRFLDTAAELFARDGYHATSIRDIARAMGVTPGAVYAHFASKAEVLLAVYDAGVSQIGEAVDAVMEAGGAPWEILERACCRHLEAVLADSGYARVVIRVLPGDVEEVSAKLTELRAGYEARFRRLICTLDLAAGVDRTLFRFTLLGALNWSQVWYRPDGATPEAIAAEIVRSLRCGVQSEECVS